MTAAIHWTPAQCAIAGFGSQAALAKVLGVERSTVHYWNKPISEDGCGGDIPRTEIIRTILKEARERGVELTPEDLVLGRDVMQADRLAR